MKNIRDFYYWHKNLSEQEQKAVDAWADGWSIPEIVEWLKMDVKDVERLANEYDMLYA